MTVVKRNKEHDGIEIYFERKPAESIREELSSKGWRWHREKKCWYKKYRESDYVYAQSFCKSDSKNNSVKKVEKKTVSTNKAINKIPDAYTSNFRNSCETIPEYIDRMIDTFSFEHEKEFQEADLTRYLGDDVEARFSSDLRRKLRWRKLITHQNLQSKLESVLGKKAKFRPGQEEAILALLDGKKVLVVQHTGWGKSLVYFLTTKILREQGGGPTIIISPLLALMHNQIESAAKYGLIVKQITSDTKNEWPFIYDLIDHNLVDVIFLSPERLGDEEFMNTFTAKLSRVSLFAIDEAHCISDWGHDFRPDFRRIIRYVRRLPAQTPILATTATANNRVLRDIKHQIGSDLEIQRGTMERPSIDIDVLHFSSDYEKVRWLIRNINRLPGTGIIYCLTVESCKSVANELSRYTSVECYYADVETSEKRRIEKDFQDNRFKVLVATIAFGMGIDKPDIGFVVHFQQPASSIAYYQQIGRAGRNIPHSLAIALVGDEDNNINSYFLTHAFPTEDQMNMVVEYIIDHPMCSRKEIMEELMVSRGWADKVLKYLLVNGDIACKKSRYHKTSRRWECDMTRAKIVSWYRWKELRDFNKLLSSNKCYMRAIREELDDSQATNCGHCANCLGKHLI